MDWSGVTPGRLATADCDGNIHIWNASHPVTPNDIVAKYGNKHQSSPWSTSSFTVEPMYSAHGDNLDNPSVEDLQWSPTEATVLASAECGGYVRIYDIRCPGKAMISNKIHSGGADVNVISWNKLVSNLLATGGDDGEFFVTHF
jgi:ribosome assembly protein RRB1